MTIAVADAVNGCAVAPTMAGTPCALIQTRVCGEIAVGALPWTKSASNLVLGLDGTGYSKCTRHRLRIVRGRFDPKPFPEANLWSTLLREWGGVPKGELADRSISSRRRCSRGGGSWHAWWRRVLQAIARAIDWTAIPITMASGSATGVTASHASPGSPRARLVAASPHECVAITSAVSRVGFLSRLLFSACFGELLRCLGASCLVDTPEPLPKTTTVLLILLIPLLLCIGFPLPLLLTPHFFEILVSLLSLLPLAKANTMHVLVVQMGLVAV